MKKSVKVMAAAMAAMMTLAGCGSKTAETTAAAEITAEAAAEETTAEAAEGVKIADGEYTIGIGQFAEHGSLDNCRTGFLQGLADEGIVEGKNLTILYENAQADGGTASQIMNNFLSKKADLICAIATPIAQSAYSAAEGRRRSGYLHRSDRSGSGRACKRRRNSGRRDHWYQRQASG